ncbi:MAG: xanthine dehydrogenase family protein subunit M [Methanomassiliicoccales archaeon]
MTPSSFDYYSPATLEEACAILEKYGGEARVLAGGQSLIPLLKMRFMELPCLVDISHIPSLSRVEESNGKLHIGSTVRISELEHSELIRAKYPAIHDAASVIADPLVRNMGTAGGNVSHGDPSNDLPAVMIALNATYSLTGPKGSREISARDFYKDMLATAAGPYEVLTSINIPQPVAGQGSCYLKHKKSAGDYSVAGVAVSLVIKDGICNACGIGLTSSGPTPLRAKRAEGVLIGHKPLEADDEAARAVSEEAEPQSDFYGSEAYKRLTLKLLTSKAIRLAVSRGA